MFRPRHNVHTINLYAVFWGGGALGQRVPFLLIPGRGTAVKSQYPKKVDLAEADLEFVKGEGQAKNVGQNNTGFLANLGQI